MLEKKQNIPHVEYSKNATEIVAGFGTFLA